MEKASRQSQPVRLLQISDTHCYADDDARLEWSVLELYPNRSLIRLLAHLEARAEDFDALVISGDLAQEESAAAYQRLGEILRDFPLPVYTLPGNHDVPEFMRSELTRAAGHIHYQQQVRFTDWYCLFLDTHLSGHAEGHLSTEQFVELANQLHQLKADEHAILFMHHHPLSIGSPWMDRMGLQQTDAFWSLLSRYPQVKAVSFGHIHSEFSRDYAVSAQSSIQVFATPATCVQVKHIDDKLRLDHARPAWRELTLHADGQLDTAVHYLAD